jgi:NADPH:quinone reductase-like Zn-dependent oxidoreductase
VKVPARATHLIPDGLDFLTAAVLARHAPLAFTELRDQAQVKPGEWVLVMAPPVASAVPPSRLQNTLGRT